ncbi:MAG: RluA family pseudouridine synthase [Clostridia bacterium]|nr:RluA family pseudouridine synthase [Clostridia bacterium]
MELQTSHVVESENKVRLDVYLAELLSDWSRSQIKLQIDAGGVEINKKTIKKAGFLIKDGDEISLNFKTEELSAKPEDIPLDIVYEDAQMAVINKPQGMVVHPAPGSKNHTLVNALLFHFGKEISDGSNKIRPGIVHRIDKDTSGLLVVAKNNVAHDNLAKQIGEHSAFRHYLALVEGVIKEDSGTIDQPLARDPSDRKKFAVISGGKRAITHYSVVQRYEANTLVEFVLETGRTHQIRVHSKFMGHPIVGDKTYGFAKQKFNLNGQLLHAYKLELNHPTTNERMTFECPLPSYFESVLKKLKKI